MVWKDGTDARLAGWETIEVTTTLMTMMMTLTTFEDGEDARQASGAWTEGMTMDRLTLTLTFSCLLACLHATESEAHHPSKRYITALSPSRLSPFLTKESPTPFESQLQSTSQRTSHQHVYPRRCTITPSPGPGERSDRTVCTGKADQGCYP